MNIAICASLHKPEARALTTELIDWLDARGHYIFLDTSLSQALDLPQYLFRFEDFLSACDLIVAIGGDGTVLEALRAGAPLGKPVLGLHAGTLGFLTVGSPDSVDLAALFDPASTRPIERRIMLRAQLTRRGVCYPAIDIVNDVVIRHGHGRIVDLRVRVANTTLGQFRADGVIIATPTGSTAYGLSAGGPIVHPTAEIMTLVPICAHSLALRPVVLPASDGVTIQCLGNKHDDAMFLSADGADTMLVQPYDYVTITQAPYDALFVIPAGTGSFYDRLREKLQWGGSEKTDAAAELVKVEVDW